VRAALLCVLVLAGARANAQTEDLPPPPEGYRPLVPDLPHAVNEATSIRERWMTVHFGAAPIFDYTWFSQDTESVEQVGVQEDSHDWRSARVQTRGTFFNNLARPWRFLVSFEYRGFDVEPDNDWSWTDVSFTAPVGPLGDLTFGKIKETFAYEMVGDAANLPHLERLLNPFFTSRNIGLRLNKVIANERATLAIRAFNDWFVKDLDYDDSGWDVTGRVTALPVWVNDGRRFLHVAGAWRYVGADNGLLRYRGRPGVERGRLLRRCDARRGHRGYSRVACQPLGGRGAMGGGLGVGPGGVHRRGRFVGRSIGPDLLGLVCDGLLGDHRRAPALRSTGWLRAPRPAGAPLGRRRADRALRRRRHHRSGHRRRCDGQMVHGRHWWATTHQTITRIQWIF
jgi:hypothetical protein